MEFIKWIPTRVKELQNKSPEEIAMTLNKLSKTPEGQKQIETLIQEFKSENTAIQPEETGMFKKGGKLNYLVNKFKNGGASEQRKSDLSVKNFHGTDLFEYGPNSRKGPRGYIDRPLVPGVNKTTLPNGVGLRQITRDNITTSELVSPDKRDTLYIHNGAEGRVDSNIDDSGFLGFLGLKKSSPVSGRYKYLQNIFNTQKFEDGGETTTVKRDTTSVDRTVVPGLGNFRDRQMQIISTFPDKTKEVSTISRMISNNLNDTTYYRTLERFLHNENPIGQPIIEQIRPDQRIKAKMK